jgi:hypothetical protein
MFHQNRNELTPKMWNVALAKGAHPSTMDPVASQHHNSSKRNLQRKQNKASVC